MSDTGEEQLCLEGECSLLRDVLLAGERAQKEAGLGTSDVASAINHSLQALDVFLADPSKDNLGKVRDSGYLAPGMTLPAEKALRQFEGGCSQACGKVGSCFFMSSGKAVTDLGNWPVQPK